MLLATALIAATLWLAGGSVFRQPADLYLAIAEESVAGLNVSAPVKYSGVDVGKVQGIQPAPTPSRSSASRLPRPARVRARP
ncbi:MAG: MCE family protein [Burkholderiaceae bacterium]|nr:MCE family protein [Burkholderiaceae bacterium]